MSSQLAAPSFIEDTLSSIFVTHSLIEYSLMHSPWNIWQVFLFDATMNVLHLFYVERSILFIDQFGLTVPQISNPKTLLYLWVKPHEYWLHPVRHWVAGVIDVVEVLAEGAGEDVVVVVLVSGVAPTEGQEHRQGRTWG